MSTAAKLFIRPLGLIVAESAVLSTLLEYRVETKFSVMLDFASGQTMPVVTETKNVVFHATVNFDPSVYSEEIEEAEQPTEKRRGRPKASVKETSSTSSINFDFLSVSLPSSDPVDIVNHPLFNEMVNDEENSIALTKCLNRLQAGLVKWNATNNQLSVLAVPSTVAGANSEHPVLPAFLSNMTNNIASSASMVSRESLENSLEEASASIEKALGWLQRNVYASDEEPSIVYTGTPPEDVSDGFPTLELIMLELKNAIYYEIE